MFKSTRLAPTPSGFLHNGNLYNFLLISKFVKQSKAKLYLRIDDSDSERVKPAYLEDIFNWLERLEIQWNEGPQNSHDFLQNFSQSLREIKYQDILSKLCSMNVLFACKCGRSELQYKKTTAFCVRNCRKTIKANGNSPFALRLDSQIFRNLQIVDTLSGQVLSVVELVGDMGLQKKDGRASYQIVSLVEDLSCNITHIIRGSDLFSSTVTQLLLAYLLNKKQFQKISFYHHALQRDSKGTKLSKSAGVLEHSLLDDALTDLNKLKDLVEKDFIKFTQYELAKI